MLQMNPRYISLVPSDRPAASAFFLPEEVGGGVLGGVSFLLIATDAKSREPSPFLVRYKLCSSPRPAAGAFFPPSSYVPFTLPLYPYTLHTLHTLYALYALIPFTPFVH